MRSRRTVFALIATLFLGSFATINECRAVADRYGTGHRVILYEGQQHPDLEPGEAIENIEIFSIDRLGRVMIFADVTSPDGVGWSEAVWFGPPDDIRLVMRADRTIDGHTDVGVPRQVSNPRLAYDGGGVVFTTAHELDPPPLNEFEYHLWKHDGADLERVAQIAPGDFEIALSAEILDGGGLQYHWLDGGWNPSRRYVSEYPSGRLVLSSLWTMPGFAETTGTELGVSLYESLLDRTSGALLFGVDVWTEPGRTPPFLGRGLYLAWQGDVDRIAHTGDPAIGAPPGYEFDFPTFGDATAALGTMDSSRRVVFVNEARNGDDTFAGLWEYDAGTRTLLVGEGDPITNRPGQHVRPGFRLESVADKRLSHPQLDATGRIVFLGRVVETGAAALFESRDSGVRALAVAGEPISGHSSAIWSRDPYGDVPMNEPTTNESGQTLLWALIDESGTGNSPSEFMTPWILDPSGSASPVVLPGDVLPYPDGPDAAVTPRGIGNYGWRLHKNRATNLGEDGSLVLWADRDGFPGGPRALVYVEPEQAVSTPPATDTRPTMTVAPNPFNPRTAVVYELPEASVVSLTIVDLRGRVVRTLSSGRSRAAGVHEIVWDGRSDQGRTVASGVYFARLTTGHGEVVRRVALIR